MTSTSNAPNKYLIVCTSNAYYRLHRKNDESQLRRQPLPHVACTGPNPYWCDLAACEVGWQRRCRHLLARGFGPRQDALHDQDVACRIQCRYPPACPPPPQARPRGGMEFPPRPPPLQGPDGIPPQPCVWSWTVLPSLPPPTQRRIVLGLPILCHHQS